jgi:hypothetical protein
MERKWMERKILLKMRDHPRFERVDVAEKPSVSPSAVCKL